MIEQINGPGLTGNTGKSGKQGKNSLFAKLFAMLDKHADVSGKGKELQLNATGLAKGKTIIATSGKGDLLMAEKSDPLATAKGKQLVALAAKGKLGSETLAEETATPLVTANVIMDQISHSKKTDLTGKATVLITAQKGGLKGGEADLKGGQGNVKGEQTDPALKLARQAETTVSAGKTVQAVAAEPTLQSGNTALAAGAESKAFTSARAVVDSDPVPMKTDKSQASTMSAKIAEPGSHMQKTTAQGQVSVSAQTSITTAGQSVEADQPGKGQKIATSAQANKLRGEKTDVQAKAETINVAAGAQLQQGKQPIHAAPGQNNAAPVVTSATVQANISDGSLKDSGSGSSDKGNQEGRTISALAGDAKSTGSASTNNANFQSYLTGKTAPTMSVFDSMKHIAHSAANGQNKLEIQLDPANLGKIQISLQTDAAKNLQVHMIVDQGTTRAALEQQLPALRAALSQQGFDLSGFSMGSNGQQGASAEGNRNGSGTLAGNGDNLSTGNSSNAVQQQSTRTADGGLSIRV